MYKQDFKYFDNNLIRFWNLVKTLKSLMRLKLINSKDVILY